MLVSQQSTRRAQSPPSGTSHLSCPLELAPLTPPPPQPSSQTPPLSPCTLLSWSLRTQPTCTGWMPGTVRDCVMGCQWVAPAAPRDVLTVDLLFMGLLPSRRHLSLQRWPVPSPHCCRGGRLPASPAQGNFPAKKPPLWSACQPQSSC